MGWLSWLGSPRLRRTLRDNLTPLPGVSIRRTCAESGKALTELLVAWLRPAQAVGALVREVRGWEAVTTAHAAGQGVIFVTPHLGCFEVAGRYLALRIPTTFMYAPPKQAWLEPFMQHGRNRDGLDMAPADTAGVRQVLGTLRHGGCVGILPDQVPGVGDGVWAPFFGRPAYTMTLLGRLAAKTGAAVVFFYGERLRWGRGYRVHFRRFPVTFCGDRLTDATTLNQCVEQLVREAPDQYWWGYNRYKRPAGAEAPPGS